MQAFKKLQYQKGSCDQLGVQNFKLVVQDLAISELFLQFQPHQKQTDQDLLFQERLFPFISGLNQEPSSRFMTFFSRLKRQGTQSQEEVPSTSVEKRVGTDSSQGENEGSLSRIRIYFMNSHF